MGSLTYDTVTVQLGDWVLLHLQIAIVCKLRRGESFLLSWKDSIHVGGGRSSIWIHPSIPLYFKFDQARSSAVNIEWVESLRLAADSTQGMVVVVEGVV